ncbi:hypothetical protein NM688_g7688 [Phlebia brevispora]|uniref:Uncharacterized protein n=1 Tax=Phlebia brevispora TaxID=194682 RepID=A0ACC1S2C0_9APHY|nr:hypothetical protein NM688_g7688 [Phlebia brevispora]
MATSNASSQLWDDPDTIIRTSDGMSIRVHMKLLAMASPVFNDMFGIPQPTKEGDQLPVVDLAEDSKTLEVLIDAIYPDRYPSTPVELSTLNKVAAAAQKYVMRSVQAFVAHCLRTTSYADSPLRVYAIACRCGLDDVAVQCARSSLLEPWPDTLPPEFEDLSANSYHKLLSFRRRCEAVFDSQLDSESCESYEEFAYLSSRLPKCSKCPQSSYGPLTGPPALIAPSWFVAHLHLAKQEFLQRVDGSAVMSPELVNKTIRELRKGEAYVRCDCDTVGPMKLLEFSHLSARILDRLLRKVPFEVDEIRGDSDSMID